MKLLRIETADHGVLYIRPGSIVAISAFPDDGSGVAHTAITCSFSQRQDNQIVRVVGHFDEIAAAFECSGEFEITRLESFA